MSNIEKSNFNVFNEELKLLSRNNIDEEIVMSTKTIKTQEKGIFKKQKEVKKSYVSGKGEYISLIHLCYMLDAYTKYIYNSKLIFIEDLQKSFCKKGECIKGFSLNYENGFRGSYLSFRIKKSKFVVPSILLDYDCTDDFSISCDKVPKLSSGREEEYNIIKDDVYNFLPYIYSYKNFIKVISNDIIIGEISFLKIKDFGALNNKGTMVTIRFGELAIFEILINNNKDFKISSFSRDINTNLFLKNNGNKLLEEIFISQKSISKILDIFGKCNFLEFI